MVIEEVYQHLKPDIKSVARREELANDFPPVLKN
jgi:hypothetical protein